MDAHQRLVADVDARGRATRLLRQDGTGESTTRLPDGKYPLRLTAEVAQPHPRAGGKEIGVMLDGMLSLQRYVMDASGNTVPRMLKTPFTGRALPRHVSRHGLRMPISTKVAGMPASAFYTSP